MGKHDLNSYFSNFDIFPHHSRILPRAYLLDRLDAGLSGSLTFICAPAGYGKTTLVNDWLKRREISAIQMSFLDYDFENIEKAEESVYVFDDCDQIGSSEIYKKLRVLFHHLPEKAHMILISREELPFSLSSLRLSGLINEIRSREFRLSDKEIAEWFERLSEAYLSEAQVRYVQRHTEGWPLIVSLAAHSFDKKQDHPVVRFPELHTYFMEETYASLSPDIQIFLLKTSYLPRMNPELCNVVTENTNSQEMLGTVEKLHLFVFEDRNEKGSLRYHPLFAEFLRSQSLNRFGNKIISSLNNRASHWFRENGFFEDAIEHALMGEDYEAAAQLINRYAPGLFRHGEWKAVRRWLSLFPKAPRELAIIQGWTEAFAGNYHHAIGCLDQADGENDEVFAEKAIVEGYIAVCRCDPQRTMELFRKATERWHGISRFFRKGTDLNLGEVELLRGRLGMGGRIGDAKWLYKQIRMLWKHSELAILGYGSDMMAEMLYEQNRCDEVMYFVTRGIELGERYENIGVLVSIHLVYMRLKWREGRINEAWTIFENLKVRIQRSQSKGHWFSVVEAIEMRMILRESVPDQDEMKNWMITSRIREEDPVDFSREYEVLTFTRGLMSQKKYLQALRILAIWDREAAKAGRIGSRIEMLILQVLAFQKVGNLPKAFERFYQALILAEPEGYIRSFLDEGSPLAELLAGALQKKRELQKDKRTSDYAKKLLVSFEQELGIRHWSKRNQSLTEPLTERELDILRCIGEGLNNSGISDRLGIKVGTVKGYVVNLYGKLGVESRAKAAVKAKELGVVKK